MEECDFGPVVVFPLDEKDPHFHVSCGIEEKEKILRIFGEFGLVVVRDIIPVEDVNDIEEVEERFFFSFFFFFFPGNDFFLLSSPLSPPFPKLCFTLNTPCLQELRLKTGLPSWNIAELGNVNWTSVYWSKYNESKGFVGYEPALGKHVCELRQNEAVLGIFETLLGTKKLAAKLDRFGLMRPTAGNPSWQTDKGFVHWDQNPTIEPDFARVQGVFLLSDHTETSGGFHAIPGFCKEKFAKYAEVHPSTLEDQDLIPVKDEYLIKTQLQRIYARRGSLIIWDSRTPHGNW